MSALRARAGSVCNALLDGPPFSIKLPTVALLLVTLEILGTLLVDARSGVGHAEVLLLLLALAALCASPPRAAPRARGRPAAASCPSPPGESAGSAPPRARRPPRAPPRPAAPEPRVRAAAGAQGQVEHGGAAPGAGPQAEGIPAVSKGRAPGQRLAEVAAARQARRAERAEQTPCAHGPSAAGAAPPAAAAPCPLPRGAPEARPAGRRRHQPPRRGDAPWEAERPRDAAAMDHQCFGVAAALPDQGALRANAVEVLRTMLGQRLVPDGGTQGELLMALGGRLPDDLSEALWALQEQGCMLNRTVQCSLMVAFERKAPRRTLQLYGDLVAASGEHALDRAAYNAALCALAQCGQADEALELFQRMCLLGSSDFGMTPNGKSYGSAIRACTAGGKDKVVLTLFDCMEEKGIMPNRFAYHDVILSCVRLRKLMKAMRLYDNMKRDGVPPCDHTFRLLIRTCTARGLHNEAQRFTDDFLRTKSLERNGLFSKDFADIGDLTTQADSD